MSDNQLNELLDKTMEELDNAQELICSLNSKRENIMAEIVFRESKTYNK